MDHKFNLIMIIHDELWRGNISLSVSFVITEIKLNPMAELLINRQFLMLEIDYCNWLCKFSYLTGTITIVTALS